MRLAGARVSLSDITNGAPIDLTARRRAQRRDDDATDNESRETTALRQRYVTQILQLQAEVKRLNAELSKATVSSTALAAALKSRRRFQLENKEHLRRYRVLHNLLLNAGCLDLIPADCK